MALGVSVDFNANIVKLQEQVDKAVATLNGFEQRSAGIAKEVNSALAGIGVGLSAAGLAAFVKSGIDAADALNDLSDRSGIAIEKLAGLEYAVKIGDTSIESFVTASNKLSINISKSAEDFERLGITAKDPVEAFKQMADVFSAIEEPQQRAALGAALMGKGYAEMAPLLMMGAEGIQALIDKGREINPITEEQVKKAGELNDRLDQLDFRFKSLAITISESVVDSLYEFGKGLDFAMEKSDGFHPLDFLTDIANGGSAADQLGRVNYQIKETQKEINDLLANAERAQSAGINNYGDKIVSLRSKLDNLTATRDSLSPTPSAKSQPAPNAAAVQSIISKSGDDADEAGKKFSKGSKGVSEFQKQIDALNKSLLETGKNLEKQRPENFAALDAITATPKQAADARAKALRDKNIEFDKVNKAGDPAEILRVAQEREQMTLDYAKEDLYGVRAGELPGYKAYDAKQAAKKAAADSQKAFERFKATGTDITNPAKPAAMPGQDGQPAGKSDMDSQIKQAEQLKKLLDDIKGPIEIKVTSTLPDQIAQADALQQKLNEMAAQKAAIDGSGAGNNTEAAMSIEVIKRGSRE